MTVNSSLPFCCHPQKLLQPHFRHVLADGPQDAKQCKLDNLPVSVLRLSAECVFGARRDSDSIAVSSQYWPLIAWKIDAERWAN